MKFFAIEKIDNLIAEKYSVSLMNDTKWDKLLESVTDLFEQGVHINYKPFFIEPIFYKEVEWVEFPTTYEDYISVNNLKAGTKQYHQCIDDIEAVIEGVGKFELERTESSIKLFAYK
ncbi:TPA: DUF6678 family protein [Vibrio parahaemolyticus]